MFNVDRQLLYSVLALYIRLSTDLFRLTEPVCVSLSGRSPSQLYRQPLLRYLAHYIVG